MKGRFAAWRPWLLGACGLLLTAQAALLPVGQAALLEQAYRREVTAVQEMAGAVLTAHPELELELAALLVSDNRDYQEAGAQALDKYGYREERDFREDKTYEQLLFRLRRGNLTAAVAALAAFVLLYQGLRLRQKRQMDHISGVLEAYLGRDYRFTESQYRDKAGRGGVAARVEEQLRQLGGQIQVQQDRLSQEKEGTKALVTDVSHQLKTPIAALKTCFELYLEAEDEAERQEFLQRSRLQMDKLEAMTGTLMNISRLESAMITLRPEPVLLEDVLLDAVNGIYAKAAAKGIELELEPVEGLRLTLDRKWTAEAVGNVLDNAVKYSGAGTTVRIRVQRRMSFARIEIEDEGMGIHKAEYHKIFQRFYRGNNEMVAGIEGAGVGLFLTRLILERQGGGVSVRSSPGKGSTFALLLPLQSVSKPLDSL